MMPISVKVFKTGHCRSLFFFLGAIFVLVPGHALCGHFDSRELDQCVEYAQFVADATVVSVSYESDPKHRIVTRYVLDYHQVIKGKKQDLPDSILLAGGRNGNTTLSVSNMPILEQGKRYVLFLRFDNDDCPILGWDRGAHRIEYDERASSYALKTHDGKGYIDIRQGQIVIDKDEKKAFRTTPDELLLKIHEILSSPAYHDEAAEVPLPAPQDSLQRAIYSPGKSGTEEPIAGYVLGNRYWVGHWATHAVGALKGTLIGPGNDPVMNDASFLADNSMYSWLGLCPYHISDPFFFVIGGNYDPIPPSETISDWKNAVGWFHLGPCGNPYGATYTLSEAVPGLPYNRILETDIMMNSACTVIGWWNFERFRSVAAHEFGHAWGLSDSNVPGALMSWDRDRDLVYFPKADDCSALLAIYTDPENPKATSISLEGPVCLFTASPYQYSITLHFNDSTIATTYPAIWAVNSDYASITERGRLTTESPSVNQSIQISVTLDYESPLTVKKDVTLYAQPPAVKPGPQYPISNCEGNFTVTWYDSSVLPVPCDVESWTLQRATNSSYSDAVTVYEGLSTSYNETSLPVGIYYYRARANNRYGHGNWGNGWTYIVVKTPAPMSISYPSTNTTWQYTVSWPQAYGATSYTLQRATDSLFLTPVTVYTGADLSWVQLHAGNGTYYYRVRANNGCGSSTWTTGGSIWVCLSVQAPIAISYPLSDPDGDFYVNWGWAYSGEIGYTVQRATNSSFSDAATVYEAGQSVLSWEQKGLAPGTYYYRVRGESSCTHGFWKAGGPITVGGACLIPPVPTGISATDGAYSNRINVNMNLPWGTETYEVWRNTSNNPATATRVGFDSAVPYTDWSAVAGKLYWYWTKACRYTCGCSGFSAADTGYAGTIISGWTNIPGRTSSPPSLVWNPAANKLQMVVRASDDSIWVSSFNSSGVFNNDWASIPGRTGSPPALAWNSGANKVQMVVRAADNSIWTCSFSSSGVFNNDWASIPGRTVSPPALGWNAGANKLQMVVRAADNSIWISSFSSSGVFNNDWASIPGRTVSPPALGWNTGANKLQMVVRAADNSIWTCSFSSTGAFNNDWVSIPGMTVEPPALAWDAAASELGMVVRAADDSIWFSTFNSTGTFNNNWVSIPGRTASPPGMAYLPSVGYFGIVVRASDDSLWETLY
jgi:hypothetical protein